MKVVRNVQMMAPLPMPTALTIGNFDGFHRGHQAILKRVRERAVALDSACALMSFEPMPRAYFDPENAPRRLLSLRDKMQLVREAGADYFICARFNAALANMSAETFLQQLVVDKLRARFVAVGADFRFGAHRAGDIGMIRRFGTIHGFEAEAVPEVIEDGQRISSTRIRNALAVGDIASANCLLGRHYTLTGRVIQGERLGRTLGFPTLNLSLRHGPGLRYGVYAVHVHVFDGAYRGRNFAGAASFGVRPTVDGREALLEIYLLAFEGDLYGARVGVSFVAFIREEQRFEDLSAMTEQMHRDIAEVTQSLGIEDES